VCVLSSLTPPPPQEHEKTLRDKRQEQEKWEAQVLRGRGSIVSHQASMSVDEPPSLHITQD